MLAVGVGGYRVTDLHSLMYFLPGSCILMANQVDFTPCRQLHGPCIKYAYGRTTDCLLKEHCMSSVVHVISKTLWAR